MRVQFWVRCSTIIRAIVVASSSPLVLIASCAQQPQLAATTPASPPPAPAVAQTAAVDVPVAAPDSTASDKPSLPELKIDTSAITGEALYTLEEAVAPSADPGAFFVWSEEGYLEVRSTKTSSSVRLWPPFASKPTKTLFSVAGPVHSSGLKVAPDGDRVAVLVQQVGGGTAFTVGDLYVWRKSAGLRRLRASTQKQPLVLHNLEWSPDGRWVGVEGYAKDCEHASAATNSIEVGRCARMLLVDAEKGEIGYRTPAALGPSGLISAAGRLYVLASSYGSIGEQITAAPNEKLTMVYYELDMTTQTLSKSEPPAYQSPDGRYRVTDEVGQFVVSAVDGNSRYRVVQQSLPRNPVWRGDHALLFGDFELDLETKQVRKLWPEDFSAAVLSADGRSAIVARGQVGSSRELRWARPR